MDNVDDTLLIARTTPQIQSSLSALEAISAEYGMHLYKIMTEVHIPVNSTDHTFIFSDSIVVPTKETINYLGSTVS